jgi:hypothetical protein
MRKFLFFEWKNKYLKTGKALLQKGKGVEKNQAFQD